MPKIELAGRPLEPIRLAARERAAVIDELVDSFATIDAERIPSLRAAVFRREEALSTGMEKGIAMPHGVVPDLDRLEWIAGIQPDGIDWETIDGSRVEIVVLFAVPERSFGEYLAALGELMGQLRVEEKRAALLASV